MHQHIKAWISSRNVTKHIYSCCSCIKPIPPHKISVATFSVIPFNYEGSTIIAITYPIGNRAKIHVCSNLSLFCT